MSTDPLTYERLRAAVEGTAAAFRAVTTLDPAGGDGDKLFPPTYQGGVYAREVRIIGGQPAPCVLLDSVQSQANRLELALLEWHRSVRAEQEKPLPPGPDRLDRDRGCGGGTFQHDGSSTPDRRRGVPCK
jgi:hypothetical protein